MEVNNGGGVTVPAAITASAAMTIFYVAILYSPTLILRLPPPLTYQSYMIRRFICAGISTVVSLIFCAFILPIKSWEMSNLLSAYGIRLHHTWEAVVIPLFLTSLMYAGSFVLKFYSIWSSWADHEDHRIDLSFEGLKILLEKIINWMLSLVYNISAWRMYIVAPLTEELVFRACMIPLLLCGGFEPYTVILLSPVFFSLAHLNHLLEFYMQQDSGLLRACIVVGMCCFSVAPLVCGMFRAMLSLSSPLMQKIGLVSDRYRIDEDEKWLSFY
ncbi:farnesylated protein-converting enzyme 2 [Artemisia annua]|uniref:intramembrane prenyl-peptidase Rce1 n=1 Tax=Artemisia annua TaxID=35608 RepID=A0A2U1KB69_ARTAN|nr:farnesylated protein-converting enzyme 2 [Artemisia annua]